VSSKVRPPRYDILNLRRHAQRDITARSPPKRSSLPRADADSAVRTDPRDGSAGGRVAAPQARQHLKGCIPQELPCRQQVAYRAIRRGKF
jgi:hypothetical protein